MLRLYYAGSVNDAKRLHKSLASTVQELIKVAVSEQEFSLDAIRFSGFVIPLIHNNRRYLFVLCRPPKIHCVLCFVAQTSWLYKHVKCWPLRCTRRMFILSTLWIPNIMVRAPEHAHMRTSI